MRRRKRRARTCSYPRYSSIGTLFGAAWATCLYGELFRLRIYASCVRRAGFRKLFRFSTGRWGGASDPEVDSVLLSCGAGRARRRHRHWYVLAGSAVLHLLLCFLRSPQHLLGCFGRCLLETVAVFYVSSTVDTRASVGLQSLYRISHIFFMKVDPRFFLDASCSAQCLVLQWIHCCVSSRSPSFYTVDMKVDFGP